MKLLVLFLLMSFCGIASGRDALFSRATELLQEGRVQDALLLKRATVQNPNDPEALYRLAVMLDSQGKYSDAIRNLHAALQLRPDFPEAECELGTALLQTNDFAGAARAFRAAIRQGPDSATGYDKLGQLYARIGAQAQALAQFRKAAAADPNSSEAHRNLGEALRQGGDLKGAIAEFRRAVSININSAPAIKDLADALENQGDLNSAIEYYRRLVSLRPTSGEAHASLGSALKRADKLTEALDELRKAAQLSPRSASAHFILAQALAQTGNSSAARKEYEAACRLDPNNAEFSLEFGRALLNSQPKQAIIELRRAIALNPNSAAAHRSLGILLRRTGDIEGSASELRQAGDLASKAEKHLSAEVHIHTAKRYLMNHNVPRSVEELRLALAAEPDSANANALLGMALSEIGKWSDAKKAFAAALQENPSDPAILFNFGVFLGRQGDFKGAARELERLLTLKPGYPRARCLLASALAQSGDAVGAKKQLALAQDLDECESAPVRQ